MLETWESQERAQERLNQFIDAAYNMAWRTFPESLQPEVETFRENCRIGPIKMAGLRIHPQMKSQERKYMISAFVNEQILTKEVLSSYTNRDTGETSFRPDIFMCPEEPARNQIYLQIGIYHSLEEKPVPFDRYDTEDKKEVRELLLFFFDQGVVPIEKTQIVKRGFRRELKEGPYFIASLLPKGLAEVGWENMPPALIEKLLSHCFATGFTVITNELVKRYGDRERFRDDLLSENITFSPLPYFGFPRFGARICRLAGLNKGDFVYILEAFLTGDLKEAIYIINQTLRVDYGAEVIGGLIYDLYQDGQELQSFAASLNSRPFGNTLSRN